MGTHPTYAVMAAAAIAALKDRKGSSRQAILKYVMANYNLGTSDAKQVNSRLKVALKNGLKNGALKNAKGTGVTGSFKVAEKPKAPKAKKPKADKPKKPSRQLRRRRPPLRPSRQPKRLPP